MIPILPVLAVKFTAPAFNVVSKMVPPLFCEFPIEIYLPAVALKALVIVLSPFTAITSFSDTKSADFAVIFSMCIPPFSEVMFKLFWASTSTRYAIFPELDTISLFDTIFFNITVLPAVIPTLSAVVLLISTPFVALIVKSPPILVLPDVAELNNTPLAVKSAFPATSRFIANTSLDALTVKFPLVTFVFPNIVLALAILVLFASNEDLFIHTFASEVRVIFPFSDFKDEFAICIVAPFLKATLLTAPPVWAKKLAPSVVVSDMSPLDTRLALWLRSIPWAIILIAPAEIDEPSSRAIIL